MNKSAKLFSVLSKLRVIDKKYSNINCGGCGVFGAILSNELNKRKIKHDIVWIGNEYDDKRIIRKTFKSNSNVTLLDFNENGVFLSHVMIRIKDKFIDAEGVFDGWNNTNWSHRRILTKITKNELTMLAKNEEGWNDLFDRDLIPKLKKDIKKIIKDLDN